MQHGHVTGTKKEKPGSADWYAALEAATLRRLETEAAAAPAVPSTDAQEPRDATD